MPIVPRPLALACLILAAAAAPAAAQWSVYTGVRAPRFSGGAVEPATGRWLMPYRPTMWDLGARRAVGRGAVGVRLSYASTSLALEGEEAVAVVKDAMSVYAIAPELSTRVARLGPGATLQVSLGPELDVWRLPDLGSRARLGAWGALGLDVPLGGGWSAAGRIGAGVSPSPFDAGDLEPGLEARALRRREASASVEYSF